GYTVQKVREKADIRWVVTLPACAPSPKVRRQVLGSHFHVVQLNANFLKAPFVPKFVWHLQQTEKASAKLGATKTGLHELCRVMGLPGKPDGISGAEVEKYYRDGHIRAIVEYCESEGTGPLCVMAHEVVVREPVGVLH